jgi:hypothetical protein
MLILEELGLIVEGAGQHGQQLFKFGEIPAVHSRLYHGFHPVISWNEGRVHRSHRGGDAFGTERLELKAQAPAGKPIVERSCIREHGPHRRLFLTCNLSIRQPAEEQGEIYLISAERFQKSPDEFRVALALSTEPKLAAEAILVGSLKQG